MAQNLNEVIQNTSPLQQKWLPQFGHCDLKNRQAEQQIEE